MYRSILVPVDSSPFAECALPFALSIARQARCGLHIVLVHTTLASAFEEVLANVENAVDPHIHEAERAYLEQLSARLRQAAPSVPITISLPDGPIASAIVKEAGRVGADLIALTTHGRGALGRFCLGSVADELIRESNVPLLLLRPGKDKPDLDREISFKHVLVPLDGSSLAEQALDPAIELARLSGADCTLLRAVEPMMPTVIDPTLYPLPSTGSEILATLKELHEKQVKAARAYLEKTAEGVRSKVSAVRTAVTIAEQPAYGILHEIEAGQIDLVALATHGRRGLVRLVLGSVADKLVRGCEVPVLLCRPRTT